MKGQKKSFDEFVEDADYTVINDAFRKAARGLSPDLAKTYANYIAEKNDDTDSKEEALMEAHTDIAAIGLVTNIQTNLDAAADSLAKQWLNDHKDAINKLSDERKEIYRVLRSWSKEPVDIELVKPNSPHDEISKNDLWFEELDPIKLRHAKFQEFLRPSVNYDLVIEGLHGGPEWHGGIYYDDIENLINIEANEPKLLWIGCNCYIEDEKDEYCKDCYASREEHIEDAIENEEYEDEMLYIEDCSQGYSLDKDTHYDELKKNMEG